MTNPVNISLWGASVAPSTCYMHSASLRASLLHTQGKSFAHTGIYDLDKGLERKPLSNVMAEVCGVYAQAPTPSPLTAEQLLHN